MGLFAGCILALPGLAAAGHLRWALVVSAVVWVEVGIVVVNDWRCPLTDVAARFTDDRADSFDIDLPPWRARNNKRLSGALFALAELFLLWCTLRARH